MSAETDEAGGFEPRRILEVLFSHGVQYVLVGGVAGTLHGSPLPTDDLDIVPALEKSNLDRLVEALRELDATMMASDEPEGVELDFSGKSLQKWLVDFRFLNLSTRFGRLDLLYRPAGTEGYRDLASNAKTELIAEVEVRLAALEDIIRSKQAAGRERDLQHLPTLRRLLERKNEED